MAEGKLKIIDPQLVTSSSRLRAGTIPTDLTVPRRVEKLGARLQRDHDTASAI